MVSMSEVFKSRLFNSYRRTGTGWFYPYTAVNKNNITNVTRNTPKTKLKEQYLALKYEKELKAQLGSKQEAKKYIMELYLNTISFGHGYSGVQTAAQVILVKTHQSWI